MMNRRYIVFRFLALISTLQLRPSLMLVASFAFDHDTADNCLDRIQDCTTTSNAFFECPITCAKALEPPAESRASSGSLDDEAFYDLKAINTKGKTFRFENLEGYVTVIAAVPLLPGVAQFYYEMLEHLHQVYPFTLEILIVPLEGDTEIRPQEKAKVQILHDGQDVLAMLQKGLHGTLAFEKRVTLYIVSANGDVVEAFVYTSMPNFQRYLRYHFVKELSESEF